MKNTISIALLFLGGGSFLWSSPRLQDAEKVLPFVGNDKFAQSVTGVTPLTVLMYQIACYGGLLAAIIGGSLLVSGLMKNRASNAALS